MQLNMTQEYILKFKENKKRFWRGVNETRKRKSEKVIPVQNYKYLRVKLHGKSILMTW